MRAFAQQACGLASAGLALLLASCAHVAPPAQPLRVEVDAALSATQPGWVEVRLANATGEERCVYREALETPDAWVNGSMTRMRFNGRSMDRAYDGGYLPPPRIDGVRRLSPGEQIVFPVDLRDRRRDDWRERRGRWDVQIGIHSWPCSGQTDPYAADSWSRWTRFAYPMARAAET